ncbi:MAG: AMP-binding protein [Syntrophorhabdaceae bacterium]|nr:AMP-binding protein [Syntrophorhabdaceae bacterium]
MKDKGKIRPGPFFRELYESAARYIFKLYFRIFHNIKIIGLNNVPKKAGRLIIISNHTCLLDGLLIWTYLQFKFKIIVDRKRAQEILLRPFMKNRYTVPIDSMNPYSLKGVIEKVMEGIPLLIFPEGRMTRTGSIMKIYEGTGFVAYKTEAEILPIHIKGGYDTIFSRKKGGRRIFAPITMTIGKVQRPVNVKEYLPKERKRRSAEEIYRILSEIGYEANNAPSTLSAEFIKICKKNGKKTLYRDATGTTVSYRRGLIGAFVLGRYISRFKDRHIGILLPNLVITALIFMGLQLFRKVPVFLNYSGGRRALEHAIEISDLELILTSRKFLNTIKLDQAALKGKKLLFLEDLKDQLGVPQKIRAIFDYIGAAKYRAFKEGDEKETAVILFTSGSEGQPKGVCLSHENIISNIHQALTKVDVNDSDYFMNALPMFHSFGLITGTILPMFVGAKTFLYVSPLHYRIIPEIIYDQGCTILMGTNTFLNGYWRKAHPYDFQTIRYIFAGAEPLSDIVFERYAKTYGIRVFSGYGITECSPIISINHPLEYRYGTVGRFLPGIEYRIKPVEGIEGKEGDAGLLFVKGKNVMKGYLKNEEANKKYIEEDGGWYDTGDIVEITGDGFIRIIGRMKRFSKISGEMVSLSAIEEALIKELGDKKSIATVAVKDEKKGEKIVLVTDDPSLDIKEVRERLKMHGFSELAYPKEIFYLKEIPKLGTGKVDYVGLKGILEDTIKR